MPRSPDLSLPPVIGVTVGAPRDGGAPEGGRYAEAVLEAGGAPKVLAPTLAPDVLGDLDGLLLTGGGDIHPGRFGRELDERTHSLDEARDAFEIDLVQAAIDAGLPVLGICRGAQVLAVALGGTLHVDLGDEVPGSLQHRREKAVVEAHRVDLDPASLVAAVTGGASYEANSSHHQGVSDPGPRLKVVGWAPDGVVEAVELPGTRWCVGVQWHPERLPGAHPSRALFRELVSQAKGA